MTRTPLRAFCRPFRPFVLLLCLGALAALVPSLAAADCPEDPADTRFHLNQLLLARDVVDREPIGSEAPYVADGERLYIFMNVYNPDGPERELTVHFYHQERDRHSEQSITAGRSPHWRTWVIKRLSERNVGHWHVEVHDPEGCVLGEIDFEVVSADG
jgi:hypothetical protein